MEIFVYVGKNGYGVYCGVILQITFFIAIESKNYLSSAVGLKFSLLIIAKIVSFAIFKYYFSKNGFFIHLRWVCYKNQGSAIARKQLKHAFFSMNGMEYFYPKYAKKN